GSAIFARTTDSEVKSVFGPGFLVRLNPRSGWGPAFAFNWLTADVDNPSGSTDSFARLRVRPLMGGIAYTIGSQPLLVSFGGVVGPSFNRLSFDDRFVRTLPAGARPELHANTSFAVRPGVGVTVTVAPRVGIAGFGGYMWDRPDLEYRDASGRDFHNRWRADAVVLSVAAVYSIF